MRTYLIGAVFLLAMVTGNAEPEQDLKAMLVRQAKAWNRGDIDGFMASYLQTDDLRFASGATVTRGWQAALDRYKQKYPDVEAMGQLSFTDLEVTLLSPDAALIFGRWQIKREKDRPSGLFTLTCRKYQEGWRIIQDHTSSPTP